MSDDQRAMIARARELAEELSKNGDDLDWLPFMAGRASVILCSLADMLERRLAPRVAADPDGCDGDESGQCPHVTTPDTRLK